MEATEQDVREYCRDNGYDYDRLKILLTDDELDEPFDEVCEFKNDDNILDGFFSEARYHWRNALLSEI